MNRGLKALLLTTLWLLITVSSLLILTYQPVDKIGGQVFVICLNTIFYVPLLFNYDNLKNWLDND